MIISNGWTSDDSSWAYCLEEDETIGIDLDCLVAPITNVCLEENDDAC
jgi:hypothetical protein